MNELTVIDEENIKDKIFNIRGLSVMLDRDLAELYEVESKRLNEQVKRNIERFPQNFRFQLNEEEYKILRSQFATLRLDSDNIWGKHTKYLPYVFTEQGVSMLSAVLKSKVAIDISIKIINSFVNMRKSINDNIFLSKRLETLETLRIKDKIESDEKFDKLFDALEDKSLKPKQGIFYDGEIYDAYVFVTDLIKSAKTSIVLLDNYIDESILTMLSKRSENVSATIYTKTITKQLQLDINKYNSQYPHIILKKFVSSHDRFLILDNTELYHIGASVKDLGKKWFAFSKLDRESFDILSRLEN